VLLGDGEKGFELVQFHISAQWSVNSGQ
jgi:hypothetical protein